MGGSEHDPRVDEAAAADVISIVLWSGPARVAALAVLMLAAAAPTPASASACSALSSRILNGTPAAACRYPYAVSVLSTEFSSDGRYAHICGGSLIDPEIVLTAAHCIQPLNRPGDLRLAINPTPNELQMLESMNASVASGALPLSGTLFHEQYNDLTHENDIALLLMSQPVCSTQGNTKATEEKASNQLMEAQVTVVDTQTCNQQLSTTIPTTDFCAGVPAGGIDACRGDSGGPILFSGGDAALDKQAGLISYGPQTCGLPDKPGVYLGVYDFLGWINTNRDLLLQLTNKTARPCGASSSSDAGRLATQVKSGEAGTGGCQVPPAATSSTAYASLRSALTTSPCKSGTCPSNTCFLLYEGSPDIKFLGQQGAATSWQAGFALHRFAALLLAMLAAAPSLGDAEGAPRGSGGRVGAGGGDNAVRALLADASAQACQYATRILGGEMAPECRFPYMSSIRYKGTIGSKPEYSHVCGGTLIDTRIILTAAHCLTELPDPLSINVAVNPSASDLSSAKAGALNISGFIWHEASDWLVCDYDTVTHVADIALLLLERHICDKPPIRLPGAPLPLAHAAPAAAAPAPLLPPVGSDGVSAAPLPQAASADGAVSHLNCRCRPPAGPGAEPHGAGVPVVDQATCQRNYGTDIKIESSMLCAGFPGGGIDSCYGDSGGPLLIPDAGGVSARDVQAGVVSFGPVGACATSKPDASVYDYRDWIKVAADALTPNWRRACTRAAPPGASPPAAGVPGGTLRCNFRPSSIIDADVVEITSAMSVEDCCSQCIGVPECEHAGQPASRAWCRTGSCTLSDATAAASKYPAFGDLPKPGSPTARCQGGACPLDMCVLQKEASSDITYLRRGDAQGWSAGFL
eukprot:scaffold13.g217.t1